MLVSSCRIACYATKCAVRVQALQSDNEKWEAAIRGAGSPPRIMAMSDSMHGDRGASLGEAAGHFLPYHVFDFWLNLALCHALLVDHADGIDSYQVCARCVRVVVQHRSIVERES